MTERWIYRKLNDLGYYYSNTQGGRNSKSCCIEEEEVAIFNFLLPKYDSAFALGDWLSTDERKTTILRYMKNLGLAHHFNGKAHQVGAAECKQENWQAITELIQKVEKRHGADALYEGKENQSRGAAVRKNGGGRCSSSSSIQDQHAESLHLPATRQRALGIKEVESLALDEVAKKMTGRRVASLGRTELAYIVEVHHAQMKDKLAEKQKQVEKQTKRQQCEEEFALQQLKMSIAKVENTLMVAIKAERSPSAGSHAEKLPNAKKLTEELKALKKQHMTMLMQAGLAEEEIKKKAEVLRQKERAIDHLAKREQAKLTQRNSDGNNATTASAARAAAVKASTGDERDVADERKPRPALAVPKSSEPHRSDAKVSKVVVLNTGESTKSDESPSTSSADELGRPAVAAARKTTASGAAVKPKRSQTREAGTKTNERESVRATAAKRREQAEVIRSATTKRQQPRQEQKLQRDDDDDERLLKKCEKERRAMKEGQRLPRVKGVLQGWGGGCLPPQHQHEHYFLDRLSKERRKRVKQMRSDAVQKVKERRKSRTSAIGGTDEAAAIIVVKDTPWATKRKKKASTTASAGKPVRLTFADAESEDEDNDTSSSSSPSEEEGEVDAITNRCDESDGNGDDLVVEMWDDGHGEEGEAGSSGEDDGEVVEPSRDDEGISKVSATVILNTERSGKGSGERQPDEFPHDNEVDESESESENDDEESDEESEPEAEVLALRKARTEWRWQRDRPERERVDGKRRTAKRRSQGTKNEERRKSEKRKEQRELDKVVSTDDGEGLEREEHQKKAKMKALVADYLRDLAEPATDLTRLEESCAEPLSEEIQQLQALVEVFEARARNRAAEDVALDEDLLRMSLEEKKRALWGDNYHADNVRWALAQQQQRLAQGGAD